MSSNQLPIINYRDFWPYYLREHARPETRAIHSVGTGLAVGSLISNFRMPFVWATGRLGPELVKAGLR